MVIERGFYLTRFRTPLDDSGGVIFVDGDDVYGGDSGMYYVGKISGTEQKIEVTLHVRQHDESKYSVFGEATEFVLVLTGKKKGADYHFEGRAREVPALRFEAVLRPAPK